MIAKVRVWMRRDSIYTQTYDEQQNKRANELEESTGDRTMREMRALYTTDHCDAERVKNIDFKIQCPKDRGIRVGMHACVRVYACGYRGYQVSINR